MNTNITLPAAIKVQQPKPTKTQITQALFERAKENHRQTRESAELRKKAISDEVLRICIEVIQGPTPPTLKVQEHEIGYGSRHYQDRGITVTQKVNDPRITSLADEFCELTKNSYFDDREVMRKIREALVPTNPLLDNPDMKDALDKMLSQIMPSKSNRPCITV